MFENFDSKSWNFFDSYQITFETYLDETIDSNKQCKSKIKSEKGVFLSNQKEKP